MDHAIDNRRPPSARAAKLAAKLAADFRRIFSGGGTVSKAKISEFQKLTDADKSAVGYLFMTEITAIVATAPAKTNVALTSFLQGVATAVSAPRNETAISRAVDKGQDVKAQLLKTRQIIPSKELAEQLDISVQALHKGQQTGRYFSLDVGGRADYYPAFFADDALRNNGLYEVLKTLRGVGSWSKWLFLTKPKQSLGARTPLDVLKEGKNIEKVLEAARAHAER